MRYLYEMASLKVVCDIPFHVDIKQESEDFLKLSQGLSEERDRDETLSFVPVKCLTCDMEQGFWKESRFYAEDTVFYSLLPREAPYAKTYFSNSDHMICEYLESRTDCLAYSRNICDILGLESLLLRHEGLLLHASFIRWQGQGVLFTAPSGTGKSTQADLWAQYEQAEIINGDRAALRRIGGAWSAWGLPYAGSSGIYRNEGAPLKGIIILQQASENRISRPAPAQIIRYLYPEVSVHHWDPSFVDQVIDRLMELVAEIPVYLLECRPDREAVELVRKTLFGV